MGMARVYVDTYEGALNEAGDIVCAIASGHLRKQDIVADLAEVCRGVKPTRLSEDETTLFKSVGCAIEDWAAARLVLRQIEES